MNLHWTLSCFWCWLVFSCCSVSTSGWDERNSAQSASLGLDEACHQICSFSFSVGSGSDERLQFLVPAASVPIPAVHLRPWCIVTVAGLTPSFCRRIPCDFSSYIDSLIGIMDEVNRPMIFLVSQLLLSLVPLLLVGLVWVNTYTCSLCCRRVVRFCWGRQVR